MTQNDSDIGGKFWIETDLEQVLHICTLSGWFITSDAGKSRHSRPLQKLEHSADATQALESKVERSTFVA